MSQNDAFGGLKYLDFVCGIGVYALGYNVKEYNDALKAQIDKIMHTSNYYYNVPAIEAADKLISDGIIGGGMLPKLNNCTDAIKNGVNRVHILDGRIPHSMLLEIFTNKGIGTAIINEEEE